jgi:hypothetical protein
MTMLVGQDSLVQGVATFIFVALFGVAAIVVTRRVSRIAAGSLSGVSASLMSPLGALFGLTAAFLAASVWQSHGEAVDAANLEARSLSEAWVAAANLPDPLRAEVRGRIETYVREVVGEEWPHMATIGSFNDPIINRSRADLMAPIRRLVTEDHMPSAALTSTEHALQTAFEARSRRIEIALHRISLVQLGSTVALGLLLITLVAVVHHGLLSSQIIAVGLTSFAVTVAIAAIVMHDNPFSGYLSVTSSDFAQIAEYGWTTDAGQQP